MKTACKLILVPALALLCGFYVFSHPAGAASDFFVSPAGSDASDCASPATACATIPGALSKAASGDTIKVQAGTYTGPAAQVVRIEKSIALSGGWDAAFTAQSGLSVIDGALARYGIYVAETLAVVVDHFTVQNSTVGIVNYGDLTLTHVTVRDNRYPDVCEAAGIANYGSLLVQSSTIRDNQCPIGGKGGGIYNWYPSTLVILDSLISHNQASSGGGIYNENFLYVVNTTISGNTATYGFSNSGGGGIYTVDGTATIKNTTISSNEGAQFGGGIYHKSTYGGAVLLENTILAGNTADSGWDCSGPLTSQGYNLVSRPSGCTLTPAAGDQLNANPRLGPLQDNGGPTLTHFLYAGSPAIDAGNPAGCTDDLGDLLTSDQRGEPRPLDGDSAGMSVCDIGAYEADPDSLPVLPAAAAWFVRPGGNDAGGCQSPATPCATINGAIQKAGPGDTVYVSADTFTGAGPEQVVWVDESLTLSGGWNSAFSSQSGVTTIDGQDIRRGITIAEEVSVELARFNIQNGRVPAGNAVGGGGGVNIGPRSTVVITASFIHENTAPYDTYSLLNQDGGGIFIGPASQLTLIDTDVSSNQAYNSGGGIANSLDNVLNPVIIDHCTVSDNRAYQGGGIYGSAELSAARVANNTAISAGGGINSSAGSLVLVDSEVAGNEANEGGGIAAQGETTLTGSSLIQNTAGYEGGGLQAGAGSQTTVLNSAITSNLARYGSGGGIHNAGDLVITNSTIALNRAGPSVLNSSLGGGIYGGNVSAYNATIVRNSAGDAGGGVGLGGAVMTLRDSILVENEAPAGPNCQGSVQGNYNLFGDASGCSVAPGAGNIFPAQAGLGFVFGLPLVFDLQPGSPAVDAGDPGGCTGPGGALLTGDQLGGVRPLDGDGDGDAACDLGAYEYDPAATHPWTFLPLVCK